MLLHPPTPALRTPAAPAPRCRRSRAACVRPCAVATNDSAVAASPNTKPSPAATAAARVALDDMTVADVMTAPPITVHPEATVIEVLEARRRCRCPPCALWCLARCGPDVERRTRDGAQRERPREAPPLHSPRAHVRASAAHAAALTRRPRPRRAAAGGAQDFGRPRGGRARPSARRHQARSPPPHVRPQHRSSRRSSRPRRFARRRQASVFLSLACASPN